MKTMMVLLLLVCSLQTDAQQNDSISTDSTLWYNQTQQLSEVVVKSPLPKVRTNANGIKVFITGSELEKVGSSKDLLKRLPTVKNVDDAVEIFGRGAADVYINGRRIYDIKELEQIPSDQIINVEIISSPGARYAASTKAVVRIKTKRPQGEGWGFRDQLKAFCSKGGGALNQLDVNYRSGGLDLSSMISAGAQNGGNGAYQQQDVYYGGKLMQQTIDKQDATYKIRELDSYLQINYQFDDNHSIGARYSFNRKPYMKVNTDFPSNFTYDGAPFLRSMSHILHSAPTYAHSFNIYYSGKIKQWQLDANIDGVFNDIKSHSDTDERQTPEGQSTTFQTVNTYTHTASRLYAAKLVAEHPLLGGSISFGTEYDVTRRTEENINPKATDNESKDVENILAFFTEYHRQFFRKLNVQAGLRMESVRNKYYEYGSEKMSKNYTDWFPSVGLSMPIGKVYLSVNYNIDIARPSFANLSNTTIFINSYSYQQGNPHLRPTYTYNLSLNASWKWLYASLSYSRVKDDIQIQNTSYSETEPLITLLHPVNLEKFNRYTLQVFASPTLFNVWHPTWGAVVLGQDYKAQTAQGTILKMNHPMAQFMWNNIVDLPHGWRVGCDMMAMTTGEYSTYHLHRPCFTIGGSVYKAFFKEKLEARLQVIDLTAVRAQPITIYGYRNLYVKNDNYTYYELTLTYKFNVASSKYRGKGAGDKQKARIQ